MYISEINISGFRNFKEAKIPFHEGVNVIIGPNNTGKSNMLRAMALALGYYNSRILKVNDLFYETDVVILKQHSPKIVITLTFTQSQGEPDNSEEVLMFSTCLLQPQTPSVATVNYEFSLIDTEEGNYQADVQNLNSAKEIWKVIEHDYFMLYNSTRWGSDDHSVNVSQLIRRFDFQFLDAIRDVNRDLSAGYNPLMKEILTFFIDYDIKKDEDKNDDEIKTELKERRDQFLQHSAPLLQELLTRLNTGKDEFLRYAKDAGATFNGANPDFDGELTEAGLFAALRLIVTYATGIEVPVAYNGLGYNNLIYMSLLLSKMQAESDLSFMKRNTLLMPILAVEECEAHLHPAMQYKFLKFLRDTKVNRHIRQAFITTHSTQIVSAVTIDELICLNSPQIGTLSVGYPRKVFGDIEEDVKSKNFVQRFLDATKADMFFADKLIFVEGIAEELLLPVFAKYCGYDLVDRHVLVVNMGGRYYNHFLKLFDRGQYHMIKKVACLTDIDPVVKFEGEEDYERCYPFEFGVDGQAEYKHHADDEMFDYAAHQNIRFFRQDTTYGKTLEYDLMLSNPKSELLLTPSVSNKAEMRRMMNKTTSTEMMAEMRHSSENTRIKDAIQNSTWGEEDKCKALIASRYLNSVSKGENALELNVALMANLESPNREQFEVPQYIKDAFAWLFA